MPHASVMPVVTTKVITCGTSSIMNALNTFVVKRMLFVTGKECIIYPFLFLYR